MNYKKTWTDIESKIHSKRILITSHDNPDEDAIYSVIAFCLILDQLRIKHNITFSSTDIPKKVHLVSNIFDLGQRSVKIAESNNYDLLVALDTGDPVLLNRKDDLVDSFRRNNKKILNIDHHAQNQQYGTDNFVDPTSSATCELLFKFFKSAGHLKVTPDIAQALLGGILGDTVILKASNVTPITLRLAADLIDLGAQKMKLVESMPTIQSLEVAQVWGRILSSIKTTDVGLEIAYFIIDQETQDYVEPLGGIHSLVSFIRDIKGVDIALSFKPERNTGKIRVGFRSKSGIDVGLIASKLGGGGHKNSAGCTIESTLDNAIHETIQTIAFFVQQQNNSDT